MAKTLVIKANGQPMVATGRGGGAKLGGEIAEK
jgi:hypothetical protein